MAISYQMTWIPSGRRWRKVYKGKAYVVSCRQLGTPETKEASWRAANAWWEREQSLIDLPTDDDRIAKAVRVRNLVEDFSKLDDEARREAVEALLGTCSFDSLKSKAVTMLAGMEASSSERTIAAQVEGWKNLLRDTCQAGQLSVGRYDAYCRNIGNFVNWIGPEKAIDEEKLEAFFSYLSGKVGARGYSPKYAHLC